MTVSLIMITNQWKHPLICSSSLVQRDIFSWCNMIQVALMMALANMNPSDHGSRDTTATMTGT